jgi:maltose O-acetyltransferase
MKYEIQLWVFSFLKAIPGHIGCRLRNILLPYKHGINALVWDHTHIDSPSKLTLGNNVSINRGCVLHAGGEIEIGNDVLIGPNVTIYSQNHTFEDITMPINTQGYTCKKVIIGNNVWIAANATILPGVIIEDDCVIGANTLVNKNIEKGSLVVGNPCRVIKKIGAND